MRRKMKMTKMSYYLNCCLTTMNLNYYLKTSCCLSCCYYWSLRNLMRSSNSKKSCYWKSWMTKMKKRKMNCLKKSLS
jgi:hypothetical protein